MMMRMMMMKMMIPASVAAAPRRFHSVRFLYLEFDTRTERSPENKIIN